MCREVEALIERHPIFKRLSNLERRKLAKLGVIREYDEHTLLYRQNEATDGMYLLISGEVEISRVNRKGKAFVLAKLSEGSTVGDLEMLDRGPRQVTAETKTSAKMVFFDAEPFFEMVVKRERFVLELLYLLSVHASGRLREINRAIVDVLNEPTGIGGAFAGGTRPDSAFFNGLMGNIYRRAERGHGSKK